MRPKGITILLLAAVACVLGIVLAVEFRRRTAAREAMAQFDRSIQGTKEAGFGMPGGPVDVLLESLGRDEAVAFLKALSSRYDCYAFDGNDRFVSVGQHGFRYEDVEEGAGRFSGTLSLTSVRDADSAGTAALWYGPPGFRVRAVRFTRDGLTLTGRVVNEAGEGVDSEYHIPWEPGAIPSPGIFRPKPGAEIGPEGEPL